MIDRDATRRDAWSAADWLHQAAELLRQILRYATPGPGRWGDRTVAAGAQGRRRTTLGDLPAPAGFPAVRPRRVEGEAVLPGLREPLDLFGDPVESVQPRVHADASWITVLSPSLAEPLAALLDSLARNAEQTLNSGGSAEQEPYLCAVVLAKRIVEAAEDRPRP
jgi:hypothetical protein